MLEHKFTSTTREVVYVYVQGGGVFFLSHKHHFQPSYFSFCERAGKPKNAAIWCASSQLNYGQRRAGYANYSARRARLRPKIGGRRSTITRNDTLGALQIGVIGQKSAYTHTRAHAGAAQKTQTQKLVFPAKHRNLLFTISRPIAKKIKRLRAENMCRQWEREMIGDFHYSWLLPTNINYVSLQPS